MFKIYRDEIIGGIFGLIASAMIIVGAYFITLAYDYDVPPYTIEHTYHFIGDDVTMFTTMRIGGKDMWWAVDVVNPTTFDSIKTIRDYEAKDHAEEILMYMD